jgi:hypothetical protein
VEQRRKLVSEHEDGAHLEQDVEGVTDVVGVELLEGLDTVTTLEDEGAAHGGRGEAVLEVACLLGEDDRREHLNRLEHDVQLLLARGTGSCSVKAQASSSASGPQRCRGGVGQRQGDVVELGGGGLWSRGDTTGDGVETVGVGREEPSRR